MNNAHKLAAENFWCVLWIYDGINDSFFLSLCGCMMFNHLILNDLMVYSLPFSDPVWSIWIILPHHSCITYDGEKLLDRCLSILRHCGNLFAFLFLFTISLPAIPLEMLVPFSRIYEYFWFFFYLFSLKKLRHSLDTLKSFEDPGIYSFFFKNKITITHKPSKVTLLRPQALVCHVPVLLGTFSFVSRCAYRPIEQFVPESYIFCYFLSKTLCPQNLSIFSVNFGRVFTKCDHLSINFTSWTRLKATSVVFPDKPFPNGEKSVWKAPFETIYTKIFYLLTDLVWNTSIIGGIYGSEETWSVEELV